MNDCLSNAAFLVDKTKSVRTGTENNLIVAQSSI